MQHLSETNSNTYNEIYRNWPNLAPNECLNPISGREVSVGDKKFNEMVFQCLTRKRQPGTDFYRQYFISAVYQSDSVANRMNGRFIFTSNENDELKLFAMAEESGKVDKDILEKIHKELYDKRYGYDYEYYSRYGKWPVFLVLGFQNQVKNCHHVVYQCSTLNSPVMF